MPGQASFALWGDVTRYVTTYHVACRHPAASDDNPGSRLGGYNPFLALNTCHALGVYDMNWTNAERQRMLLRRGQVLPGDGRSGRSSSSRGSDRARNRGPS